MNIKKFLKPDWRKIAVFVILYIWATVEILSFGAVATLTLPLWFFYGFIVPLSGPPTNLFMGIIFLLPVFIYLYLLSCFILWIYDKTKKKK